MSTVLYGHSQTLEIFDTLFLKKTVPHGILLSGKKSIGKRKLARELAKRLLSSSISDEATRNKQAALIDMGQHPDMLLLNREEGSKQIKVEQIRSLKESLSLSPYYNTGMVAVIDDAHTMNISAANSLLKTLEEPEANKYIILISDRPHLLPDTILSRCHHFSSAPLSKEDISLILKQLFNDHIDSSKLHELSRHTQGSLALLDLSALINERTLTLSDPDKGKETVLNLLNTLSELSSKIDFVFEAETGSLESSSRLIQLVNSLEKEPALPLFWDMFMEKIRFQAIHSEQATSKSYWANKLIELSLLKTEIDKRNLVPSIQSPAAF